MLLPDQVGRSSVGTVFRLAYVVLFIAGVGTSAYFFWIVDHTYRAHIVDRASTIAQLSHADLIVQLAGDESDLTNPAYQLLKREMMEVYAVNSDTRFVYILQKRPSGEFIITVDSEDPQSPDYSPPGQVYEEVPAITKRAYEQETEVSGFNADRWGMWVSGFAPIRDEFGHMVAIVGVDVPATDHFFWVGTYAIMPLIVALLMGVVLSLLYRGRLLEEQRIQQKAEFLSVASHEIRSPLTGVKWAMDAALETPDSALHEIKPILTTARDTLVSLIARTNNLLDVALLETRGAQALKKEPTSLLSLIQEVVNIFTLNARERQISFVIDPSITPDIRIVCDAQHIHHALFNVVSNAVKYTQNGTHITLSYAYDGTMHHVSIRDEGKGMSAEELKHVFDGYYRTADAQKMTRMGTGLGLYLTKKTAEAHGGSVEVTSHEGEGTTLTIVLPA